MMPPLARLWWLLPLSLLLAACEQRPVLERILERGELVVASRNGPTTLYEGPDGPTGLEYDLVTGFARELGVQVRFRLPDPFADILTAVRTARVHMGAAGLTATPERRRGLRFSRPYQQVTQQLVYRRGSRRPRSLDDLGGGRLEVVAGSAHEERLRMLREEHPGLRWYPSRELDTEELLYLLEMGEIDYTVADSNTLALNQRYYPHVRAAFAISEPQPLAWAFPRAWDDSLLRAADAYLQGLEESGRLARLLEHYYGHVGRLNFVDRRTFWREVKSRLPGLRPFFEEAARATGRDWRLLAAIAYQESHWDPKAVSPTGVRGVMMLTRDTARQVGVKRRTDPRESILGGARYLEIVERKIPARIPEPDRLWLALAGYNVGFGHLEDARILTQRQGGDPDRWAEVRLRLPLLAKKKYYRTLRHGYARGREPVTYVDNIRNYYDLLIWHTENRPQIELERAAAAQEGSRSRG